MAIDKLNNVAVVGAGLAGLSLAILLKQHGISSTVYDLRPPNKLPYSGPLALTPNGLRATASFGLYDRLKAKGWLCRTVTTISNDHEILDQREVGNADKYGYDALRVYRQEVIDLLTEMCDEADIPIVYEKKYTHVVSETDRDVTIAFEDGEQKTHDLLVGADGIHSVVRKYLYPEHKNAYAGRVAIAALAPSSSIKKPYESYPLPASINGPHGHIIIHPLGSSDSVCPVATTHPMPELDKQGWADLEKDTPRLIELLRHQYDKWNPMVQGALDAIDPDTLFMWPFYSVPKLPTWKSSKSRVVIFGDSAHGVPPIGALGANLAFEDAQSLGSIIACANQGQTSWENGLQWWQDYRMSRMQGVTDLTMALAKRRQMNGDQSADAVAMRKNPLDDGFVFKLDIEKDVREWIGV